MARFGTGPARSQPESSAVDGELERWRVAILEWYAWLGALACVIVAAFGAAAPLIGVPRASYLIVAAALIALGLARNVAFRVRALLLLAVMYVGGSLTLFASGTVTPNGAAALCALAVVATALLGRRWGVAAAGLGGTTILATALLLQRGARPPAVLLVNDLGHCTARSRVPHCDGLHGALPAARDQRQLAAAAQ